MKLNSKKLEPTKHQQDAIYAPPGPLMILAGAGTGKTFTILRRAAHMINTGKMRPEQVVILTFTEKAARDLRRKLHELTLSKSADLRISTFHAFCVRLVKEFRPEWIENKTLVESGDLLFLLAQKIDEMEFLQSTAFRSDPLKAIQQSFLPFFNRVSEELLTPDILKVRLETDNYTEELIRNAFPGVSDKVDDSELLLQLNDLVQAFGRYQDWKRDQGWMDYGDMILNCWMLLRENPNVLEKVRKRYRHFIVDEYQDNNYALNQIIRLILGTNPSITVVGDQDQCIYSFRGANYYNIQDFETTYLSSEPEKIVTLEENFRSTKEILDLANAVISQDLNRKEKTLRPKEDKTGPKPTWYVAENASHPDVVLRIIEQASKQGWKYGDMAVLCRTTAKVKDITQALERAGIPVDSFVDHLFGVPAIRDLMAWSEVIIDGQYFGPGLGRILKHLQRKNPEIDLSTFRGISTLEELSQAVANESEDALKDLISTITTLREGLKKKYSPPEVIWDILDKTDLLQLARREYRYVDRLNLVNIGHLLTLADQFHQRDPDRDFSRWVRYLNILSLNTKEPAIQPEMTANRMAVQVMTIHRSKGLEFPVVILPYLRSGSLPTYFRPAAMIDCLPEPWYSWPRQPGVTPKSEHEAEERRIFYVGITRAQRELYLVGPERAGCKFLKSAIKTNKDLVNKEEWTLDAKETDPMTELAVAREKLFVELNREIIQKKYTYARQIIEAMEALDEGKPLPNDNPYTDLVNPLPSVTNQASSEPLKLSASAVETYLDCPLKYRLGRIDGIPQKRSQAQMEFGSIIHEVLKEFLAPETDWNRERLLMLLDHHWKAEAFEYRLRSEELYGQAKAMLLDYLNFIQSSPPKVRARETPFRFMIEAMNVEIKGKIDRVDLDSQGVLVVDYKTGKLDPTAKPGKNLQLALYVLAISRGAVEEVPAEMGRAQLIYLRHLDSLTEPYMFSGDELEENLARVETAAQGIRSGKFEPNPNDRKCHYCDYRDFLCPVWENG